MSATATTTAAAKTTIIESHIFMNLRTSKRGCVSRVIAGDMHAHMQYAGIYAYLICNAPSKLRFSSFVIWCELSWCYVRVVREDGMKRWCLCRAMRCCVNSHPSSLLSYLLIFFRFRSSPRSSFLLLSPVIGLVIHQRKRTSCSVQSCRQKMSFAFVPCRGFSRPVYLYVVSIQKHKNISMPFDRTREMTLHSWHNNLDLSSLFFLLIIHPD